MPEFSTKMNASVMSLFVVTQQLISCLMGSKGSALPEGSINVSNAVFFLGFRVQQAAHFATSLASPPYIRNMPVVYRPICDVIHAKPHDQCSDNSDELAADLSATRALLSPIQAFTERPNRDFIILGMGPRPHPYA